jgi:hypothetical protein
MEMNAERTVQGLLHFGSLLIIHVSLALLVALHALDLLMDNAVLVQLVSLTYLVIAHVPLTHARQTNI